MSEKYKITEKEIEEIKKIKGQCRGQTIVTTLQAVLVMEGKEGLAKIESRLKELNCWPDHFSDFNKNIKVFEWYPLWQDIIPSVAVAEVFNWGEEKMKEFGINNQKVSFFEKILLKYFVSLKLLSKTVTERWSRHYSVGHLESAEVNEKERRIVLRLKDFSAHPVFCQLLCGYFQSAACFVVASNVITCQETKCAFKGDTYHEFLITWQ